MRVGTFTDQFDNFVVSDFASADECRRMLEASDTAKTRVRATVGADRKVDARVRNNTTAFLDMKQSAASELTDRVATLLTRMRPDFDASECEAVQVQIYDPGEHYTAHTDSWADTAMCPHTVPSRWRVRAPVPLQRPWTCVLYLNDVPKGGTTTFPKVGATLRPERGKLACWKNVHDDLSANVLTEHQGDDVLEGRKFLANFWFTTKDGPPCTKGTARRRLRDAHARLKAAASGDMPLWASVLVGVLLLVAVLLLAVRMAREVSFYRRFRVEPCSVGVA